MMIDESFYIINVLLHGTLSKWDKFRRDELVKSVLRR